MTLVGRICFRGRYEIVELKPRKILLELAVCLGGTFFTGGASKASLAPVT
jgi:hypothetical protein